MVVFDVIDYLYYYIRCFLRRQFRIFHGTSMTHILQHFCVIVSIAKGHTLCQGDLQMLTHQLDPFAFVDTNLQEFDKVRIW